MNRFDEAAKTWDSNPVHWERSKAIAEHIKQIIDHPDQLNVLEFGAGTGILSFLLKDIFKEITLMDTSVEMVKMMIEKAKQAGTTHLHPVLFDLVGSNEYHKSFDLIYTQMVLHHIEDIPSLLTKFYRILNPGGILVVADLYSEDGSFHGEGFTGHLGFDLTELSENIRQAGFCRISSAHCFTIRKQTRENTIKEFPVFCIQGYKPE